MSDRPARFCAFKLEVLSALHLGRRRAGMVAQTYRHAPAHLFTYALAAAVGARRGAQPADFASALTEIVQRFRFGPAFFMDGDRRLDDAAVSRRLVTSSHHVTLDNERRAGVEGALFETELLQPNPREAIRLCGGVWLADDDSLDGEPISDWLGNMRLGGELKTGCGHVRCADWKATADHYPGIGPADAHGLHCPAETLLPGAALDGVADAPLQPWLGRRFDPQRGCGRATSAATLVRMNGRVVADSRFLPSRQEPGLGCWQTRD